MSLRYSCFDRLQSIFFAFLRDENLKLIPLWILLLDSSVAFFLVKRLP